MNWLDNMIQLFDIYLKEVQSFFDIINVHQTINLTGEISNTFHQLTIVPYLQALIKHLTKRLQDSYVPLSSFFTLLSQPDTISDADISEIANFFHIDTNCFYFEFKLFKEYLRIRGITTKKVLIKLAATVV